MNGDPADAPSSPWLLTRSFLRRLAGRSRRRLLVGFALAMLAALSEGVGLMALVPLLALLGIGGAGPVGWAGRPGFGVFSTLDAGLLLFAVLALVLAAVGWGRSVASAGLRMRLVDDLRCQLHDALLRVEWHDVRGRHSGELSQVVITDVARAGIAVDTLAAIAQALMVIPVLLAVAFSLSPRLAALTCLALAVAVLASRRLDLGAVRLGQVLGQGMKRIQVALNEDLAGLRLIKSCGAEARRDGVFAALVAEARQVQMDHARAGAATLTAIKAAGILVAVIGMAVAVRGFGLGVSEALVLVMTFARVLTSGLRLHDQWRRFLHLLPGHAAAEALLEWCRRHAEPAAAAAVRGPSWRQIRLDGIGYRHDPDLPPALDGVSMVLPAGSLTMVIGPSGAGKSTLGDILLGLLPVQSGRLLADDTVVAGAVRAGWRAQVGYMPQTPFLFDDSIRANLAVAAPDADDGALWRALEAADAAALVRALPHGLDSVVGERGTRLSGGQVQRLTLARALVGDPRLLVLDEATSAVDADAEARIMRALLALRGRLTIVAITHRTAWLDVADQVVVLDHGRVSASGSWAEIGRDRAR